ncbi:MAG: hypothetical protein DRO88_01100 [Promethearchaeia archaeon]|nr:MAG: hypothetical protein DRO88_01100 [Candidatus Lokiarchaeia archaeon]
MPFQYFIFLDANFLLIPAQFKIDFYQQFRLLIPGTYQIIVPSAILKELKHKAAQNLPTSTFSRQLKLAFQILENEPHKIIDCPRPETSYISVDDWILQVMEDFKKEINNPRYKDESQSFLKEFSSTNASISKSTLFLATNDKILRKKALEKGFATIFLRQKQRLEVIFPKPGCCY